MKRRRRHQNLDNEITGKTHYDKPNRFWEKIDWIQVLGVAVMIGGSGVIYWLAF